MTDLVPTLVATKGALTGRRFALRSEGLVVGRDASCDVVVSEDGVSRQHARLLLQNGSVWLQDYGSRNGVYVNDKRLARPVEVSVGDRLRVGSHEFTLELEQVERDVTETKSVAFVPAANATTRRSHLASALVLGGALLLLCAAALAYQLAQVTW